MPQVMEEINLPLQLKQAMPVNEPMFTKLKLARLAGFRRCVVALQCC
jgi:hypothetical protein